MGTGGWKKWYRWQGKREKGKKEVIKYNIPYTYHIQHGAGIYF